jgi:hypothetical protein
MSSRQLDEILEEKSDRHLAEVLGITYEDLSQLDYDFYPDESRGGLINGQIIIFSDSSPKKILRKIKGIDDNNTVYLGLDEFE